MTTANLKRLQAFLKSPLGLRGAATVAGAVLSLCCGAAAAEWLHLPRESRPATAQQPTVGVPILEGEARANALAYPYAPPPVAQAPDPTNESGTETVDAPEQGVGADDPQRPMLTAAASVADADEAPSSERSERPTLNSPPSVGADPA